MKCGCVCDACDGVKGSMMGDDDGRLKETFELDGSREGRASVRVVRGVD